MISVIVGISNAFSSCSTDDEESLIRGGAGGVGGSDSVILGAGGGDGVRALISFLASDFALFSISSVFFAFSISSTAKTSVIEEIGARLDAAVVDTSVEFFDSETLSLRLDFLSFFLSFLSFLPASANSLAFFFVAFATKNTQ